MWFDSDTPRPATTLTLLFFFIIIADRENSEFNLFVSLSLSRVENVHWLLWDGPNLGQFVSLHRGISSGNPVVVFRACTLSFCCMAVKRSPWLFTWRLCLSCQAKARKDGRCRLAHGANVTALPYETTDCLAREVTFFWCLYELSFKTFHCLQSVTAN